MNSLWTDIAIGSGILLVCGVIFNYLYNLLGGKVDKELYETRHTQVVDGLERGEDRFDKIESQLSEHTETLHNIDKNLALVAQTVTRLEKCALKRTTDSTKEDV